VTRENFFLRHHALDAHTTNVHFAAISRFPIFSVQKFIGFGTFLLMFFNWFSSFHPSHGQNRNHDKIGTNSRRSQWRLPAKWPLTNDTINMIRTYLFAEFVLDMFSIQIFEILHLSYWSIRSEFAKDIFKNLVIFSAHSSPTWDRNSQYCRIILNSPYFRTLI